MTTFGLWCVNLYGYMYIYRVMPQLYIFPSLLSDMVRCLRPRLDSWSFLYGLCASASWKYDCVVWGTCKVMYISRRVTLRCKVCNIMDMLSEICLHLNNFRSNVYNIYYYIYWKSSKIKNAYMQPGQIPSCISYIFIRSLAVMFVSTSGQASRNPGSQHLLPYPAGTWRGGHVCGTYCHESSSKGGKYIL